MVGNVIMAGVVLLARLILLVAGLGSGSLLWWCGWLFAPGLQLAILVSQTFGTSNIGLVIVTWLWAVFSEWCEIGALYVVIRRWYRHESHEQWP